ncbi:hypothetical protein [Corynebacterium sphenisci]|uniref:hypothetical protein n=1 Tax=Corynebacterium sphenisci TaxID=191493 RepID=UPI0026DF6DDD|nr:hypothetical protein [Corynebacterium sphenisci]MDO5730653.1 hypothetical protein [Corynebacterium sphenisci]
MNPFRATLSTLLIATMPFAAIPAAGAAAAPAPAPGPAENGSPTRPATTPVLVGPGDPIRIPVKDAEDIGGGVHAGTGMCSANMPGTVTDADGNEHRVLITAGHCVDQSETPGMPSFGDTIYAPTTDGDVRIGKTGPARFNAGPAEDSTPDTWLDELFNGSDWAFIELDDNVATSSVSESFDEDGEVHGEPVELTGIVDYEDLEPGEVSVDNLGKPVCTDGNRTGRQCGVQVFRVRNGVWAVLLQLDHGDSGGMAYDPESRRVIGINSMAVGPLNRFQPADIAIEEAYGIPDGEVNGHFEPAGNPDGANRRDQYRTINEDTETIEAHREANPEPGEPGGDGSPLPIPLPAEAVSAAGAAAGAAATVAGGLASIPGFAAGALGR